MDNAAYLKQIAAQPNPKDNHDHRLLSPAMIKVLITGAAALVLVIILGIIINSSSGKITTLYESFYLRLQNLSANNGPVAIYAKDVRSSELRALAGTLRSSLYANYQNFSGILGDINIDPKKISETTSSSEADILSEYTSTLQNARLNGLLDRTFANSTTLQISYLIAIGSNILERNPPDQVQTIVNQAVTDLEILHTRFANYSNSSS
jgi:hypothetical protein